MFSFLKKLFPPKKRKGNEILPPNEKPKITPDTKPNVSLPPIDIENATKEEIAEYTSKHLYAYISINHREYMKRKSHYVRFSGNDTPFDLQTINDTPLPLLQTEEHMDSESFGIDAPTNSIVCLFDGIVDVFTAETFEIVRADASANHSGKLGCAVNGTQIGQGIKWNAHQRTPAGLAQTGGASFSMRLNVQKDDKITITNKRVSFGLITRSKFSESGESYIEVRRV